VNRFEALTQLQKMCAYDSHPTLDDEDLSLCLDAAKRPDSAGNSPANDAEAGSWVASTDYLAGAVILVSGRYWRATLTGTTGSAAPSWPDLAGYARTTWSVIDGDMTWVDNGAEWAPTWSLNAAAAAAWDRKAAKAAGDYDFGTDGQTFSRSQVVDTCMKMARRYRGGGSMTLQVTRC